MDIMFDLTIAQTGAGVNTFSGAGPFKGILELQGYPAAAQQLVEVFQQFF